MHYHFGPTNVAAWELGLAVEAGTGPDAAERLAANPINLSVFGSTGRVAYVHFDLARAWAQAEGARDAEAIRHLDAADRMAPVRVRNDTIARDLVVTLDRRARHRPWELDSLCHRFGLGRRVSTVETASVDLTELPGSLCDPECERGITSCLECLRRAVECTIDAGLVGW